LSDDTNLRKTIFIITVSKVLTPNNILTSFSVGGKIPNTSADGFTSFDVFSLVFVIASSQKG